MCRCLEWTTAVLTEKENKDGDDSEAVTFWFCGVKCSLRATTGNCGDRNMESVGMNYVLQSKDTRQWKMSVIRCPHLLLQLRHLFVTLPFVSLCLPPNKVCYCLSYVILALFPHNADFQIQKSCLIYVTCTYIRTASVV
jgi:hypothetical protein